MPVDISTKELIKPFTFDRGDFSRAANVTFLIRKLRRQKCPPKFKR